MAREVRSVDHCQTESDLSSRTLDRRRMALTGDPDESGEDEFCGDDHVIATGGDYAGTEGTVVETTNRGVWIRPFFVIRRKSVVTPSPSTIKEKHSNIWVLKRSVKHCKRTNDDLPHLVDEQPAGEKCVHGTEEKNYHVGQIVVITGGQYEGQKKEVRKVCSKSVGVQFGKKRLSYLPFRHVEPIDGNVSESETKTKTIDKTANDGVSQTKQTCVVNKDGWKVGEYGRMYDHKIWYPHRRLPISHKDENKVGRITKVTKCYVWIQIGDELYKKQSDKVSRQF